MLREILDATSEADAVTAPETDAFAYVVAVALWLMGVAGIVVHKLRAA